MTRETCATCRWHDRGGDDYGGKCRRMPPHWRTDPSGMCEPHWAHPYTDSDDWCGEHQSRKAEPEQPKAREPGPYWVSPKRWNNWVVAHASIQPGTWFLPGEEAPVGDEDMLEIDERRIVRDAGS